MIPVKGKPAPDFSANNQDGKTVSLNDFKGKKLVLYFYPKDDTPGCTAEACSLRDNYHALIKQGYAVLGVSPDNEKKHLKFIAKFELPFDLLADTDHKIAGGLWRLGREKYVRPQIHGDYPHYLFD